MVRQFTISGGDDSETDYDWRGMGLKERQTEIAEIFHREYDNFRNSPAEELHEHL